MTTKTRSTLSKQLQADIVAGIINNNDDAVREFVGHFAATIAAICRVRINNAADANEIATTVLHDLVINIRGGKYDPQLSQLQTYVANMTRYAIMTYHRNLKKSSERHTLFDEATISVIEDAQTDHAAEHSDQMRLLERALNLLTGNCKKILQLKYLYEKSYAEITSEMDLNSEASARGRIRDCLQQARKRAGKAGLSSEHLLFIPLLFADAIIGGRS